MWFEERRGKTLPFLARWRTSDGKKEARSFADPSARSAFAAGWLRQRDKFGALAQLVEARTLATWNEFRKIVGDVHPLTVAREWVELRGSASSLTIEDAWADFNADQENRKLSGDTHSHRRLHGKRICAHLRGKTAASVETEAIDAWLAAMESSPKSKRHHLKTARHFFEWLKDRRKIPHNPCDAVTLPDATVLDENGDPLHHEVNILTVEQVAQLLRSNRDEKCIGRLALECLGGLRYTSAARLVADDIQWDDRGIVMPGPKHKSGKRHFVDGWPDALWAWMKLAPASCWQIPQREYLEEKRRAFTRAAVKSSHNCLRHSFATYHLAAFKDARLTAYLMTKTSIQSLNNDYRGRATQADGLTYFQIKP